MTLTATIERIGTFTINTNKRGTDVTIDPVNEPTRGYSQFIFKTRADAAAMAVSVAEQLESAFGVRPSISIA